jgi:hypothetical protein
MCQQSTATVNSRSAQIVFTRASVTQQAANGNQNIAQLVISENWKEFATSVHGQEKKLLPVSLRIE